MFKKLMYVGAFMIANFTTNASAITWVKAQNYDCKVTCEQAGQRAVSPGKYGSTQKNYHVCVGSFDGWRPGYNLEGQNGECAVGHGGKEKFTGNYFCQCE